MKSQHQDSTETSSESKKSGSVSCPTCGKLVSRRADLSRHLNVHLPPELKLKKSFKCDWPGCTTATLQKSNLMNHYRNVHLNKKDKFCPHCDFVTGDAGSFSRHKKACTAARAAPILTGTDSPKDTTKLGKQPSSTRIRKQSKRYSPYGIPSPTSTDHSFDRRDVCSTPTISAPASAPLPPTVLHESDGFQDASQAMYFSWHAEDTVSSAASNTLLQGWSVPQQSFQPTPLGGHSQPSMTLVPELDLMQSYSLSVDLQLPEVIPKSEPTSALDWHQYGIADPLLSLSQPSTSIAPTWDPSFSTHMACAFPQFDPMQSLYSVSQDCNDIPSAPPMLDSYQSLPCTGSTLPYAPTQPELGLDVLDGWFNDQFGVSLL
ncbi:uncharacterized protein FIBRA_08464 [Fibroporia radiculosa]|uniref:C2H2-type domain-containing protein n=1 Tax=Fibroporia radiculosa TaxID=599839 RepID=J4H569_9APHY|nr:uncharacterized protein FIBRA_08464 [Fibroporia radiculosa]CCM06219.1 predicted protein [Fibroporia radiculosa]